MTSDSDRIVTLSSPVASPGVCGLCGVSDHPRGFISMDLHFEFYGSLIFCYDCTMSMNDTFGGINPDRAKDMLADAEWQFNEINRLTSELDETRVALNAISHLYSTGSDEFVSSGNLPSSTVESIELGVTEAVGGIAEAATEPKSNDDEPVIDEGSLHVSSSGINDESWLADIGL